MSRFCNFSYGRWVADPDIIWALVFDIGGLNHDRIYDDDDDDDDYMITDYKKTIWFHFEGEVRYYKHLW